MVVGNENVPTEAEVVASDNENVPMGVEVVANEDDRVGVFLPSIGYIQFANFSATGKSAAIIAGKTGRLIHCKNSF